MFNSFDVQVQIEESYVLGQFCTCDRGIVCELCSYVDSQIVDSANKEFDMASPVVEPWSFRSLV